MGSLGKRHTSPHGTSTHPFGADRTYPTADPPGVTCKDASDVGNVFLGAPARVHVLSPCDQLLVGCMPTSVGVAQIQSGPASRPLEQARTTIRHGVNVRVPARHNGDREFPTALSNGLCRPEHRSVTHPVHLLAVSHACEPFPSRRGLSSTSPEGTIRTVRQRTGTAASHVMVAPTLIGSGRSAACCSLPRAPPPPKPACRQPHD